MILVSNHLLQTKAMTISSDSVIRINVAWVKDEQEFRRYLDVDYDVFVDYPDRRKKPPVPKMSIDRVINIIKEYDNIKFFAISNAETHMAMESIRKLLPDNITIVPKIETEIGVKNILKIVDGAKTDCIMLDKEDLYTDSKDNESYLSLMNNLRYTCGKDGIRIFELEGVIFSD